MRGAWWEATLAAMQETIRTLLEEYETWAVVGCSPDPRRDSNRIAGLLQSKGKNPFGMDRDDVVVMPVRTFQRRLSGSDDINQIQLSVRETVVPAPAFRGTTPG